MADNPKVIVVAHTSAALGANAVYRANIFQAGIIAEQVIFAGLTMLKGFFVSDVSGRLDIYQASEFADATAITNGVPAAGLGNATLWLQTFNYVSAGAADTGQNVAVPLVAPWVVVRYTNGAAAQATFRLHLEATE